MKTDMPKIAPRRLIAPKSPHFIHFRKSHSVLLFFFLFLFLFLSFSLSALDIPSDDPRLIYASCAEKEIIIERGRGKIARLHRMIPHSGGQQNNNPGASVRFRTNARSLSFRVRCSDPEASRESTDSGLFYIDGVTKPEWKWGKKSGFQNVKIPADGMMHEYEIVFPLTGSVEIRGLTVNDKAEFKNPESRSRMVFYGDDPVASCEASSVENTLPFLIGRIRKADVVNMGFPGIALTPWHAEYLARIPMDRLIVMIGSHDAGIGTPPPVFRKNIERFMEAFRKKLPRTEVIWIAPVAASGSPDLEPYRESILSLKGDKIRILDGKTLLTGDDSFFSPGRRCFNDVGVRQFAENLSTRIEKSF